MVYHVACGTNGYMTVPVDDFYYYLSIAKNIVATGHSTYDGVTSTNGYHPLWMAIIVILQFLSSSDQQFFVFLSIVCFSCSLWTAYLLKKFLFSILPENILSGQALILSSTFYAWMSCWAMETTITIPLYLLAILQLYSVSTKETVTTSGHIFFGAILSLCALARLDLLLFDAFIVLIWAIIRIRNNKGLTLGLYILIGFIPLAAYYMINLLEYGSVVTTSALAKTMKVAGVFNTHLIGELYRAREAKLLVSLSPIACCAGIYIRKTLRKPWIFCLIVIVTYPICYFLFYSVSSDWILFIWYTFPLPLIIVVELFIIGEAISRLIKKRLRILSIAFSSILMLALLVQVARITIAQTINWYQGPSTVYWQAVRLAGFIKSHPGHYAMGDRAGLTQYIIQRPIFQAEGLVADRRYLSCIDRECDLCESLEQYGVDHLIVSTYDPLSSEREAYKVCMPFAEQAGRSKQMIGWFSKSKAELLLDSAAEYAIGDPIIYTYILDLH
jgi:hypothetical protein